jgi:hypothetical protein
MKYYIFVICVFLSSLASAKTFDLKGMQLDVSGYVGYQFIGTSQPDKIHQSALQAGLVSSLQINNNWSAFAQIYHSNNNIANDLAYAFLAYDKLIRPDFNIGFKVGKLRHELGLYNYNRINPRTRQGIIVPQAIYWDSLRYFFTSGTGINLNAKIGNLDLSYSIDKPVIDDRITDALSWFGGYMNTVSSNFGDHQSVMIKYSADSIPLVSKFTWGRANFGNDTSRFVNRLFPEQTHKNQSQNIVNFGMEYSPGKWTLSAEAMAVKLSIDSQRSSFFQKISYGTSVTAKYELNDNVSVYANWNRFNSAHSANPLMKHTDDFSIGANYHIDNWQIALEGHRINGARWLDPANNFQQDVSRYKEWYMIGTSITYFFN